MFPISIGRVTVAWLIMAFAMTVNGIGRELVLKRVVSAHTADILSAIFGMTLIGVIAARALHPLSESSPRMGQLVLLSVVLVAVTVIFESVIGRIVDHKSWSEIVGHYYIWRGELWPIVLLWLASMPFIVAQGA